MRDVIVIGAGGGGPVVAKELAARGLDVLLLEGGSRFAKPEVEWTPASFMSTSVAFRWGPLDPTKPPYYTQLDGSRVSREAGGSVAGVGGMTLHYWAGNPRAVPGVFTGYAGADAEGYDVAHRFPFSYEHLRPYYEWVEKTLPVATSPVDRKAEVFIAGALAVGLPVNPRKDVGEASFRPQENAILQPGGAAGLRTVARAAATNALAYPGATGCTSCGYCTLGCAEPFAAPRNLKAKRSTDNSYVPMALTSDVWAKRTGGRAVTLVAQAMVTHILTEGSGSSLRARAVTWRDGSTGAEQTEEAAVVVLAAGAIESPRLWLLSGLPDPNNWVGHGLTDHGFDWVYGVFDSAVNSTQGPVSTARVDIPGRGSFQIGALEPAALAATLAMGGMGRFHGYPGADAVTGSWDGAAGAIVGPELKEILADVNRVLPIVVFTDDDVEPNNRVELSPFPVEPGGAPAARLVQPRLSSRTRENREDLVGRAVALLRAAGATRVLRGLGPETPAHPMSSLRMGMSEDSSVLDESCEARAVPRLFVADNSALPNSLGGPNPTLTTQALATRTAERIFVKYFGGSPWVGAEAPISSIDPAVTAAVVGAGL